MNFDDLKDKLKDVFTQLKHQAQESPALMSIYEKFLAQPISTQKAILVGSGIAIAGLLLWIPVGFLSNSWTSVEDFEIQRDQMRRLLHAGSQASSNQNLPRGLSTSQLESQVNDLLLRQRLLPEQMASLAISPIQSTLFAKALQVSGLRAELKKLNLEQVTNIAYDIQEIGTTTKLLNISMLPNAELKDYFDLTMDIVSVSIPVSERAVSPPKRGFGNKRAPRGGQ